MPTHGRSGLFVSFEGVEGSGKSTQVRALREHLARRGVETVVSREPGGTPIGERLRSVLLDHAQRGMLPLTELFLYLASRAEHVARVVGPALERGAVVVSDRYADASTAYQGGGRGLGWETVEPLNRLATGGVQPDITFLLDLDPEEGLSRFSGPGGRTGRDRIESEALEVHRRVRAAYLDAAKREPARFVVIDARRGPDEIALLVAARTDELLTRRGL
jgi:dTMP kinase